METCVQECEKYETEAGSRQLLEETRRKMDLCRTKEELARFCVEFCCHLLEECIRQRKNGVGRAAKQIQDYLKEHYAEEANLEKIAEKIGLTSAYISTIFKKETGMTLSLIHILFPSLRSEDRMSAPLLSVLLFFPISYNRQP